MVFLFGKKNCKLIFLYYNFSVAHPLVQWDALTERLSANEAADDGDDDDDE